MKVVIQVVDKAKVEVEDKLINQINKGYMLLVGIEQDDNEETIKKYAAKVVNLRINPDENGKTNLSILDIKGEILSISQFTICAKLESRRPSFSFAAKPDMALKLYNEFNNELRKYGIVVKDGAFGEEMIVSLVNHGPFTIVLDKTTIK